MAPNNTIKKTGQANCQHCTLRSNMLFASLSIDDLNRITQPIDQLRSPARITIYTQDDVGQHVFTIRSGLIKLTQYAENGTPRIVRLLSRGDVAGLEILVDKQYRHTAETISESELCRIPLKIVQDMGKACSSIYDSVIERMQKNLDGADDVIVQFSTGTAQTRVARFLLVAHEKNLPEMCLQLTREEIASMLGLTVETVSRTFAEFKRKGFLQENTHSFAIDSEALTALAK
jgi:CRP/FNR family transcriptional regulator, anaerobic regulatory protein